MSCIILRKTWSVISKLFLLNCMFHYISNWYCSKVLEFYLTSFFNTKSWRVKLRNFLGDFPVHYAALFINRTINNNYDFINGLASYSWWILILFLDAMLQEQQSFLVCTSKFESAKKAIPHKGCCVFPDVILVPNYQSYKAKTIKPLPCYSFYGGHIPPRKIEPPFLTVRLNKMQKHQDAHLAAFP